MELLKWKWKDCGDGTTYEGICTATKSDILRKAKELIDVSEEKIDAFIWELYCMVDDEKSNKEQSQFVCNFVSSLFESNNSQINKEV